MVNTSIGVEAHNLILLCFPFDFSVSGRVSPYGHSLRRQMLVKCTDETIQALFYCQNEVRPMTYFKERLFGHQLPLQMSLLLIQNLCIYRWLCCISVFVFIVDIKSLYRCLCYQSIISVQMSLLLIYNLCINVSVVDI